MAESLKQLRTLLTTLLTVSLLWLVTAHSVSDALVRRAHAKELLAWLTIRDALIAATDQLADENTQVVNVSSESFPSSPEQRFGSVHLLLQRFP